MENVRGARLPDRLRLLRGRGAGRNALGHAPRRVLDDVRVFPVLDLLHPDLPLDQLVHVRDDDWPLDVHQREGRRRFAAAAQSWSLLE